MERINSRVLKAQTKYLRKTLVFMWNSALWEKFNFYFQGVLTKMLFFGGRLGTRLYFDEALKLF